ncbi:MAG TPA: tripartite tricarboxylate transporter TctB family protein [Candidatus Limnocylindria bacterium]|nr:tripartite tricarboxylate transporter TctB family protein [Candidatus Limnocylindria bacterium]
MRAQRWAAAVLTVFGVVAVEQAWQLPVGSLTRPAAGFFPLCMALGLTVAAAVVWLHALRGDPDVVAAEAPTRGGLARAAATLATLLAYAFVLEPLGFGVATFALVVVLLRAIEPQRWAVALGGGAAAVLVCHVVFRLWLGVRLPVGPWGF